ncbi:MAG: glycosyltransferase family 39 protein [Acidaminococcaceae bacterium]|jgi:4-amino-4-deoxy-L-arabinose transferase-like glycosyltransferase|nr:glycosyltransferase family 39 protein [Acidaminococcaceae bacterium]
MCKKYGPWVALAVLLLLLAGNNLLPVTDNVESNYALTAKEMVLSGDWVSPRIYGNYWFDKPVMFYWLTALAYKLLGFTDFASRLAPALFGTLAVVMAGFGGCKLYSQRAGLYSMLILGSSLLFFALSKLIITDAVLFVFFNATLLFFYLGYSTPQKNYYYVMYAAAALATLTKGPVGFLLPGLIIVLFLLLTKGWRELTRAKLCSGTCLFLLIGAPWYYEMYKLHGAAFLDVFLGVHNVLRATVSEHPRDNVWYYYIVLLLLMAFPWISYLPPALRTYLRKDKHWQLPAPRELFLLLSMATVFFFFQNMATKYPTYTYPLLFPLALFLAGWWDQRGAQPLPRWSLVYNTVFCLILAAAALFYQPKGLQLQFTWLLALILLAGLIWQWRVHNQNLSLLTAISLTTCVFYLGLTFTVMLPITRDRSAAGLARQVQVSIPAGTELISYGDYPTSLVYYSGRKIWRALPDTRADQYRHQDKFSWSSKNVMPFLSYSDLQKRSQPVIVVDEKYYPEFQAEFAASGAWIQLQSLPGWQIWQRK